MEVHKLIKNKESKETLDPNVLKMPFSMLAEIFQLARNNEFSLAIDLYNEKYDARVIRYPGIEIAAPYLVWSGMKSGKVKFVKELIEVFERATQASNIKVMSYDHILSKAFYFGLQGDTAKAVTYLKKARYHIPSSNKRLFYSWYQLIEICEWLYIETGKKEYRDMIVEYSKIHQKISPHYAWAYAFEAKYTTSRIDKKKALGITMYLDPQSERISNFSQDEKNNALVWFKNNNHFKKCEEENNKESESEKI